MKNSDKKFPACSSLRNGNFLGRNFDWYYDECATFIVKTKEAEGRHASIGVAGGVENLTDAVANSGNEVKAYKYLPFYMLDGINDAGVSFSINVVPMGDKGLTLGTNPGKEKIATLALGRFILDNADSAEDAVRKLYDMDIYSPLELNEEYHYIVADTTDTFIIEFVADSPEERTKMVYLGESAIEGFEDGYKGTVPNSKYIMTNFYLTDWDGDATTKAHYTGTDEFTTTLTPHAMGTERYEILADGYSSANSKNGMMNLLESVKYTNAYESLSGDDAWYSELNGNTEYFGDLTVESEASDYDAIAEEFVSRYESRVRTRDIFNEGGYTWQTVHKSVYDIQNKKLYVVCQEGNNIHEYSLEDSPEPPVPEPDFEQFKGYYRYSNYYLFYLTADGTILAPNNSVFNISYNYDIGKYQIAFRDDYGKYDISYQTDGREQFVFEDERKQELFETANSYLREEVDDWDELDEYYSIGPDFDRIVYAYASPFDFDGVDGWKTASTLYLDEDLEIPVTPSKENIYIVDDMSGYDSKYIMFYDEEDECYYEMNESSEPEQNIIEMQGFSLDSDGHLYSYQSDLNKGNGSANDENCKLKGNLKKLFLSDEPYYCLLSNTLLQVALMTLPFDVDSEDNIIIKTPAKPYTGTYSLQKLIEASEDMDIPYTPPEPITDEFINGKYAYYYASYPPDPDNPVVMFFYIKDGTLSFGNGLLESTEEGKFTITYTPPLMDTTYEIVDGRLAFTMQGMAITFYKIDDSSIGTETMGDMAMQLISEENVTLIEE